MKQAVNYLSIFCTILLTVYIVFIATGLNVLEAFFQLIIVNEVVFYLLYFMFLIVGVLNVILYKKRYQLSFFSKIYLIYFLFLIIPFTVVMLIFIIGGGFNADNSF